MTEKLIKTKVSPDNGTIEMSHDKNRDNGKLTFRIGYRHYFTFDMFTYNNTNILSKSQFDKFVEVLNEGFDNYSFFNPERWEEGVRESREFFVNSDHLPLMNEIFESSRREERPFDTIRAVLLDYVLDNQIRDVAMVKELLVHQAAFTFFPVGSSVLSPSYGMDGLDSLLAADYEEEEGDSSLWNRLILFFDSNNNKATWRDYADIDPVFNDHPSRSAMLLAATAFFGGVGSINRIDFSKELYKGINLNDFLILIESLQSNLLPENFDWAIRRMENGVSLNKLAILSHAVPTEHAQAPLTTAEAKSLFNNDRYIDLVDEVRIDSYHSRRLSRSKYHFILQVLQTIFHKFGEEAAVGFISYWRENIEWLLVEENLNKVLKYFNDGSWKLYDSIDLGLRVEGYLNDS